MRQTCKCYHQNQCKSERCQEHFLNAMEKQDLSLNRKPSEVLFLPVAGPLKMRNKIHNNQTKITEIHFLCFFSHANSVERETLSVLHVNCQSAEFL